jgi:predicted ester cyclase
VCNITVTQVGTFMGIEPTGKRVSVHVMDFFRLEEGKMAEM